MPSLPELARPGAAMPPSHARVPGISLAHLAPLATLALVALIALVTGCASADAARTSPSAISAPPGSPVTDDTLGPGAYALVVLGMSCPKCVSNVDMQLARIEGIRNPKIDMLHGIVRFEVAGEARPTRAALLQAILDAGFTLREIRRIEPQPVEVREDA